MGNCIACHTVPGGEAFAGGLAVPTQFGTVYSTNITPDEETGIGAWSEEAFARAMHEGVDRGNRHLYPAFPYDHFTLVTPEDEMPLRVSALRALGAYANVFALESFMDECYALVRRAPTTAGVPAAPPRASPGGGGGRDGRRKPLGWSSDALPPNHGRGLAFAPVQEPGGLPGAGARARGDA